MKNNYLNKMKFKTTYDLVFKTTKSFTHFIILLIFFLIGTSFFPEPNLKLKFKIMVWNKTEFLTISQRPDFGRFVFQMISKNDDGNSRNRYRLIVYAYNSSNVQITTLNSDGMEVHGGVTEKTHDRNDTRLGNLVLTKTDFDRILPIPTSFQYLRFDPNPASYVNGYVPYDVYPVKSDKNDSSGMVYPTMLSINDTSNIFNALFGTRVFRLDPSPPAPLR